MFSGPDFEKDPGLYHNESVSQSTKVTLDNDFSEAMKDMPSYEEHMALMEEEEMSM